jgi:hypothetical protein
MTNSPDDAEQAGSSASDQHEFLKKLVDEKDTDENLQKLAKSLAKDLKTGDDDIDPQPDLSYEKFRKKLSEGQ